MAVRQARTLLPERSTLESVVPQPVPSPVRLRWRRLGLVASVAALPLVVLPWLVWGNIVAAVAGAVAIGMFAAGCWWWSRRFAGESTSASAAELERARVAGELHDIVTDNVASIVVEAERAEGSAEDALRAIAASGRESLGELRRLSLALPDVQPGAVLVRPGLAQLDELVAGARRAGLRVRLLRCGRLPRLSVSVEQAVFRVVDESLMNVVRHAGPVDVELSLTFETDQLTVRIVNSPSELPSSDGEGAGLSALRERVRVVGGGFEAGRLPDRGFHVRAWFPVSAVLGAVAVFGAAGGEGGADLLQVSGVEWVEAGELDGSA